MNTSVALLLLFLFSAHVLAHDWMITPVPRGGVPDAQTTSPCEPLQATSKVSPVTVGQGLAVSWGNGHMQGVHTISIAPFGQDTTVADFKVLDTVTASTTQQPQVYELPASTFDTLTPGSQYSLRWSWTSYQNCATLRIANPTPANAITGGSLNVTTNPVTKTPLVDGDYILVANNQPIGVYNVYTGTTDCMSGYVAQGTNCVQPDADSSADGSGMTPGGKAALAFFILGVIGIAAVAAFSHFKKGDALFYVRRFMPNNSKAAAANNSGPAYVAFVDNA